MEHLFAVDRSLGSLAKWLRVLGFDTVYDPNISTSQFDELLEDHRVLITRTIKIQKAFESHNRVFITSNFLLEQLKQVVDHLGIKLADIQPFSRCIRCNLPIEEIRKKDVLGLVPDYIWETHDLFNRCHQCRRVYWSGTHTERSLKTISQIFNSEKANSQ